VIGSSLTALNVVTRRYRSGGGKIKTQFTTTQNNRISPPPICSVWTLNEQK